MFDDGTWQITAVGRLCSIIVRGIKVEGGAWKTVTCPYKIPEKYRPKKGFQAAAYAYPSANAHLVISANENGTILIGDGNGSSINSTLNACASWVAGV